MNAPIRPAPRRTPALRPVAAACAALALAAAAQAQAQTQETATQTVTVTGIRRAIESSISIKKNSDLIVESISAEDIGKLPDNSIAESIARLPGLAAQRVAGRAQVISVRGLSPDFSTTLLNGREIVSTGDNRSVEFDQYPSELLSGATIYKTPDAGLIGQGLSGTIDLQSVRPLAYGARTIALGARLTSNSLGSAAGVGATGNRVNATFIDQYAGRTVGLAIGFAHQETPIQENQTGLYEPWKVEARPGLPAGTYVTDGLKALRRTGKTTRDAVMATLEFRPSSRWTSVVDVMASEAKQVDTANQWESHLYYNGDYPCSPACNWTNASVNGNSTLLAGTVANTYPLVRGMYNERNDRILALGWGNKLDFGGARWTFDLSRSQAKREETNLETNSQLVPYKQLDTLQLDFNPGGFAQIRPGLDYSDPTRLLLRGTIYGSGYGKVPRVEDTLNSVRLSALFAAPKAMAGFVGDFDVGVNYADRFKKKRQPEGAINLGAQGDTPVGADLQYSPVDLGFAGLGRVPAWNVPAAVARYMVFQPDENADYLIAKAWEVREKIATVYAKALVDTTLAGRPLRGNFGVQVQRTEQSSNANYVDNSITTGSKIRPVVDGATYTDILPSLNLALGLTGDQTLRLGVARQVARPRVDEMRASFEYGVGTNGVPGGSGGNPRLKPWLADAIDLSWEKYFGTRAYVSAAAYYKKLRSYIYTQAFDYDFTAYNALVTTAPFPTVANGKFTAPYNGQGGSMQGVELTASLPLNLLTPSLDGFGVIASASFNDSSIRILAPGSASSVGSDPIMLPGLSKQVVNLTAYYERGGFEARLSNRQRSDFIGEIGNFNGERTLRYVKGENVLDMQLGYSFKEGAVKGLGVVFQINNLTDSPYQTYAVTKDRPLEFIKWGRTYLLGANYRF